MSVSTAFTPIHPPTPASVHLSGDSRIFIGCDVNVTPEVDTQIFSPCPGMRHVELMVVGPWLVVQIPISPIGSTGMAVTSALLCRENRKLDANKGC